VRELGKAGGLSSLGSPQRIPAPSWGGKIGGDIGGGTSTGLEISAEPTNDHEASGIKIELTAHEAVVFGDVGFINADGEVQLVDADDIDTSSALVMAIESISADAAGLFLLYGIARDDSWAWTVGGLIFISTTGTSTNTLTQTRPSGADDVIQVVGVAMHADRMFFNPQLTQVEHI
jgi:hypothetical protein